MSDFPERILDGKGQLFLIYKPPLFYPTAILYSFQQWPLFFPIIQCMLPSPPPPFIHAKTNTPLNAGASMNSRLDAKIELLASWQASGIQ